MAWDFETEPEFERELRWMDAFVREEVEPVLGALQKEGFRLAVVSNWDRRLHTLLEDLGLAGRFETIVVSSEVGHAKPDPRIFRAAVKRFGLEPV